MVELKGKMFLVLEGQEFAKEKIQGGEEIEGKKEEELAFVVLLLD